MANQCLSLIVDVTMEEVDIGLYVQLATEGKELSTENPFLIFSYAGTAKI